MADKYRLDAIKDWLRPNWERTPILVVSVYYVLRLIFFAVSLDHSVPPDEVKHLARCELFSESLLIPERDPDAEWHERAVVGYSPYAYYFLAGKLLHLNVFGLTNLMFLRFVSVLLGILTVYTGWRVVCLLSNNLLARLLFLVMMTNTLMLIVSQSIVTYDALVNLLAALSILFLLHYFKEPRDTKLISLGICLALGTLTKSAFLPFAFIVVLCLLFHERQKLLELKTIWQDYVISIGKARAAAWGVLAVLVLLNLSLFGGNLLRFGHLGPRAEQLLSIRQIMGSPSHARNYVARKYLSGELNVLQAVRLAQRIELPAARNDTLSLLKLYESRKMTGRGFRKESRLGYAYGWIPQMFKSTYGILGHKVMYKETRALVPYMLIFGAAGILVLVRWRPDTAPYDLYLLVIFVFYAIILMQVVGYRTYSSMQVAEMGVQGRYLFPALVPAYALAATALLKGWPQKVQIGIVVMVAAVFVEGDFLYYLRHASEIAP